MWRKLLIVLFGALCCNWAGADAPDHERTATQRHLALVIGNGDYRGAQLANPANDARAMSDALRLLGFEVMRYENLDAQQMQSVLADFQRRLDAGGTGLFYFSGHGLQVADKTLLLPVDVEDKAPATLLNKGVDLKSVLDAMSAPRPAKRNLVILDTCLNNPFSASRTATSLAPQETLIAYATAPGTFAGDTAHHGLFTSALLRAMRDPDQDMTQRFHRAVAEVRAASNGRQRPWLSPAISEQSRLDTALAMAPDDAVTTMRSRGVLPKDSAEQYELTFWDSIKDSNHISDYEAYLQAYPNGRFAALARARIERLRKAAPKAETPAPPAAKTPAAKSPAEKPRPAPAKAAPAPSPAPSSASSPAPQPSTVKSAGAVKDCATCPDLVALPAGEFTMGSNTSDPSEKPAHRVTIGTPFAIGKYEVTVAHWDACADAGACPRPDNENRPKNTPMRDVSWDDAQLYVKWLAKVTGKPYRLPTEAEWEYAARGGTTTRYWWGDQMQRGKADCKDCGDPWQENAPTPVGSFAPNPFGLYDTSGSVWEWVSDCWHNNYKGAPHDGKAWDEANCRMRVIRGGSWREGASYMPSTTRFKYDASVRQSQNGFRVARDNK
ncbi:MAG TPA: SUMF1/EgtB/PvdO family nonheme iron enzyme [Noviherbaspirillum sp.]|uniref:SUMF1/EgtB/PvdO family nonheme iron enzyme n=1 Tax=Noviherbaspirillum sp. TaxID=1926288 RepID=UPI002B4A11A4|nr:SUMF1/EgtB/PvdO family nonheme iron enzyme [Noviherbaspirillum sp.]HJV88614.1 SUMF1/EgtB/PvdO family nonheme iron enzyme [Noviherbaspirillum sp.]